jgi:hypothetical protein
MEKKSIMIYSGIVLVGLVLMVGVVFFLRSRGDSSVDSGFEELVRPPTRPSAVQNLPASDRNAETRGFESLNDVPSAKTSGDNTKIIQ